MVYICMTNSIVGSVVFRRAKMSRLGCVALLVIVACVVQAQGQHVICGANEEYVLSKSCPPDECQALVTRYLCNVNEVEQERCRCQYGFLRNGPGTPCIPACDCPEMADSPAC